MTAEKVSETALPETIAAGTSETIRINLDPLIHITVMSLPEGKGFDFIPHGPAVYAAQKAHINPGEHLTCCDGIVLWGK